MAVTAASRLLAALVVVATVLSGCAGRSGTSPGPSPAAANLPAGVDLAVERVVDGDTVIVTGKRRVRLIGVDAPETKDPRRPVGCFGQEASSFLTRLLPPGTPVRLTGDQEQTDRYGRLLAYLYRLPDGLFVNAELVRQGFAQVLTVPPNVAHADEFVALARQARADSLGLWAACS